MNPDHMTGSGTSADLHCYLQDSRDAMLSALDGLSEYPERRETTFGALLVRVVAETAQHAGHADILRELIDGRAGSDHDDVGDPAWWAA